METTATTQQDLTKEKVLERGALLPGIGTMTPSPTLQTDSVWIHFGLGQCKITNGLIRLQHLTVAV